MKNSILIIALFILGGFPVWSEKQKEAKSKLEVKNGDFSDLSGLQETHSGWYAGLPQGWGGLLSDTSNVWNDGKGNMVGNVSTMSQISPKFVAFTQEVGMVSVSSEVTLTFDVSDPWRGESFVLGAAIYDAVTDVPLAKGEFIKAGTHSLKADIVPSGTRVKIGFWAPMGTTPGIDNVKIESKPLP